MTNTLSEHLERLLGVSANSPRTASRTVENQARALKRLGFSIHPIAEAYDRSVALRMDREEMLELGKNEDFILFGLPKGITLYTPTNIVQAVKEFYVPRGLQFSGLSSERDALRSQLCQYEDILHFRNSEGRNAGFVQLDLGPGFRTEEGKYELWVTTSFL
jgi:hypothetical protein